MTDTWDSSQPHTTASGERSVAISGAEAVVEAFHAIQDVGRWWP